MTNLCDLTADAPIITAKEDKLARSGFSKKLATTIKSWRSETSLVVGLNGPWGCGKTSIKNMVVSELHEDVHLLEFNPWRLSGQSQLTGRFFKEISQTISKDKGIPYPDKAIKRIRYYGSLIELGLSAFQAISKLFYLTLGFLIAVGLISSFTTAGSMLGLLEMAPWFKWLSGITTLIAGAAVLFIKPLKKLAAYLEAKQIRDAKTLDEEKNLVADTLASLEKPIVIVMDDIDRLDNDEIRRFFQLIKANGDFPRIIYLLLFDRIRVEHALSVPHGSGRKYLEKMVQLPFDVPAIDRPTLDGMLFDCLNSIMDSHGGDDIDWNGSRWHIIYHEGLAFLLTSLRDLKKIGSALRFHFSMFHENNVLDVNPMDLIAIEFLRLFEPKGYAAMLASKSMLLASTGAFRVNRHEPDDDERRELLLAWIREHFSPDRFEAVKVILGGLFPQLSGMLDVYPYESHEERDVWLREVRICHSEIFDRYFQLVVPAGQLSQSEINEVIESATSPNDFEQLYGRYLEEGREELFFRIVDSYREDIPVEDGISFLAGLMNIADNLDYGPMFTFDPQSSVRRIAYHFLMRIENAEGRDDTVEQAHMASGKIGLMGDLLQFDRSVVEGRSQGERLFSEETYQEFVQIYNRGMERLFQESPDQVMSSNTAQSRIYTWSHFDNSGTPQQVLTEYAEHNLLQVLRAFVSTAHSSAGSRNFYRFDNLDALFDMDWLRGQIDLVDETELDEGDTRLVELIRDMYARHSRGESTDGILD